jgi:2-alkyl-3-oxoalkanoate reductase
MKVLVTGGGGFLGQAICRRLVARGIHVTSYNRSQYPALDAMGVQQVQGDLVDFNTLRSACAGQEAVFHVAAKAGAWGSYQAYFASNVQGTANVIAACRMHRIARLVYTSTPSVTHRRTHPVIGGNERDTPLGSHFLAWYPATKRIAEENVLAANDRELATIALRPRLIWGPGDHQLLPRLVARARQGRLRFVGDGCNQVDTTYIDNAAQAHLDAFDHLTPGARCAGHAYFISNGEPKAVSEMINALLRAVDAPTVHKTIPFRAAYWIGALLEGLYTVLPLRGEPAMTRFLAEQLSTTHFYDISAAERDFGYRPTVSIAEGLRRLGAAYRSAEAGI